MTKGTARRRRGALVLGLAAALATAACTSTPAPPPTLRVDRGDVTTTVSASGKLVSVSEQNLGFAEGGRLAEVLVKVGDQVQPGQILARLDNFALTQALEQSRAQLAQQQAALDKLRNGNSVEAAQANVEQAQKILDATEEQVDATNDANRSATERARVQLDFDRSVLERAERRLKEDREDCDEDDSTEAEESTDESAEGGSDQETGSTGTTSTTSSTGGATSAACQQVETSKAAVQDAKRAVISSETALDSAQERERVDAASGKLSIENAKQSVLTAQNELDSAGTDRPADIESQSAAVQDAQAAVALAERKRDDAALRAPVAGVVSAINGAVGEFVGPAAGATALAPGSTARLPDVSAGASAPIGGGTGAPSGGGFIVLNNVDTFQLVVPFEEADAARVGPGQQVEVSVDAVPDLTRPGTVLAVAPTGAEASGIVNYDATIILTESDPRLRDGQTAEAAVTVETRQGVLRVPSVAVTTDGNGTHVTSPGSDGPRATPFDAGLAGDRYTEVLSGLNEGQEVLLPQGDVPAAAGVN
jgi:HlyD family secretion protein